MIQFRCWCVLLLLSSAGCCNSWWGPSAPCSLLATQNATYGWDNFLCNTCKWHILVYKMADTFKHKRNKHKINNVKLIIPEMTCSFLTQLVFSKKKKKRRGLLALVTPFLSGTPPPKKKSGSAPGRVDLTLGSVISLTFSRYLTCRITSEYINCRTVWRNLCTWFCRSILLPSKRKRLHCGNSYRVCQFSGKACFFKTIGYVTKYRIRVFPPVFA